MQSGPRVVWNYREQDAGWDTFSSLFLLLFFDDHVLSGYLWYTVENLAMDNSAPDWLRRRFEE
jgi:hypothetical protein